MPVQVSARFVQTLASSDQTRVSLAMVYEGKQPIASLGEVVGGHVDVDATAQIRRTCSLSVISQGLDFDQLVPTSPESLLHPASGYELRLFRGFDYTPEATKTWQQRLAGTVRPNAAGTVVSGDASVELCPLGVFRMTRPRVVDTGDAITITVDGNDRSSLITARKWRDVYPIAAGTDLRQAVYDMVQSRIPDLDIDYRLEPAYGLTVPTVTYGTDLAGQNDPYADASQLAVAAAKEMFFDVNGALVMQAIPDPSQISSSFAAPDLYQEGVNCTMVEAERDLDETRTYNGVIVIGVGSGGPPVRAEVWDTDPSSPTYVGGPWGYQPYVYQSALVPSSADDNGATAYGQALAMAQTLFNQVRTMLDIPAFQCVPNPALLESDGYTLVRKRIGLDGEYTSAQLVIPLDTASLEMVTCRPRNVPVGAHPPPAFKLGTHGG